MPNRSPSVWREAFGTPEDEPETGPEEARESRPDEPVLLVGIDFSPCSTAAFERAVGLALRLQAAVEIMHVFECADTASAGLDREGVAWFETAGIDPHRATLRRGIPWIELMRRARGISAAFVVAGTHGRSGRQPLSLGSTASRLAIAAPCPVLLVKTPESPSFRVPAECISAGRETKYIPQPGAASNARSPAPRVPGMNARLGSVGGQC